MTVRERLQLQRRQPAPSHPVHAPAPKNHHQVPGLFLFVSHRQRQFNSFSTALVLSVFQSLLSCQLPPVNYLLSDSSLASVPAVYSLLPTVFPLCRLCSPGRFFRQDPLLRFSHLPQTGRASVSEAILDFA
jgi:hypothetical protein